MDAKLTSKVKLPRRLGLPSIGVDSANLKPLGRYLAKDVCETLGVPLPVGMLLGFGYVTGRSVVENLKGIKRNGDQTVVRPADQPLSATRGIVGLRSNLTPAHAVVKIAGMAGLKLTGPARSEGEEACGWAVKNKEYREGEVLVIRYAGPQGGPGMRDILAHGAPSRGVRHAAI
jgi:dihydroxy-acid dehydratase